MNALRQLIDRAEALQRQGLIAEALAAYKEALTTLPPEQQAMVCYNMGALCSSMGFSEDALAHMTSATRLLPTFLQAKLAQGTLLEQLGKPEESLLVWQEALNMPETASSQNRDLRIQLLNNLGRLLEIQREFAAAEEALFSSLKLDIDQSPVIHHWMHLRQKQCKWPSGWGLGLSHQQLLQHASPLSMLGLSDNPAHQLAVSQKFVKEKVGQFDRMVSPQHRYDHDKIRIGYLSSDLSTHAVSLLTVELFETHDRSKFEVHAFCWSKEDGTAFRERVREAFDYYHLIGDKTDEEAARLIVQHEIDVLVDLQGLTSGARPNILARGPAPLQVAFLGFPGPTAIPYMDYVVADPFIFPAELKPFFTEKPLYLPTLFQTSDSQRDVAAAPSRESLGLPLDKFVFCAFNNNYKITPELFESWMRILRRAPESVLWLLEDNPWSRQHLTQAAQAHGVDPDRLHFSGRVLPADYLARFKVADLFLDTTPYNAGTTASDALWAGLPILTLSGRTYVSRMAGSLLHSAGLDELVTFTHADYEDRAAELALQPKRVQAYKETLQRQRLNGQLFSTRRFCSEFESAITAALPPKSNDCIKAKPGKARSTKFKLLVRGWRGINHSYAMVNQYQLAELTLRDDIELYHEDLPYLSPDWSSQTNLAGFDAETQARLDGIAKYQGQPVDAAYSIGAPIDLFRGRAGKNFTFMVTEFGLKPDNFSMRARNFKRFTQGNNWVITPSRWSKGKLVDFGLDPQRIHVIPHGVDTKVFKRYAPEVRQQIRSALGFQPEHFVYLNIGGAFWNKGLDLLLKAFCTLRLQDENLRLILKDNRQLYGANAETLLVDLAKQHPELVTDETVKSIMTIPGALALNQLADLYNVADAYVSPYRAEGFNMPVLEAMGAGLPVVVTAGGATDDFVGPSARRLPGKLVQPQDTTLPVAGCYIEPDYESLLSSMKRLARHAPTIEAQPSNESAISWLQVADQLTSGPFEATSL